LLWLAALGYESDCNVRVVAIQQSFFPDQLQKPIHENR